MSLHLMFLLATSLNLNLGLPWLRIPKQNWQLLWKSVIIHPTHMNQQSDIFLNHGSPVRQRISTFVIFFIGDTLLWLLDISPFKHGASSLDLTSSLFHTLVTLVSIFSKYFPCVSEGFFFLSLYFFPYWLERRRRRLVLLLNQSESLVNVSPSSPPVIYPRWSHPLKAGISVCRTKKKSFR